MTNYPTDLSNSQWEVILKYLDTQRSRKYDLRHIMDAILYLVKTGSQWRMLPHDFPNWKIVYYYFSTWKKTLVIEHMHEELVEKIRKQEGRNEEPSVGIIDAQSVKNTLVSSESRGFDAGKKVKGIKRHVIVDSLGLILAVVIRVPQCRTETELLKQWRSWWSAGKRSSKSLQTVGTEES